MTTRTAFRAASLALICAATVAMASASRAGDDEKAKVAKFPIVRAIEKAEAKGGGKATEAEYEDDQGGRWDVRVLSADGATLTSYFVDPISGELTGEAPRTTEKYFGVLKAEDFQSAPTQIKDAIASAEKAAKGKAVKAVLSRSKDAPAYDIEIATVQDSILQVRVNSRGIAMMR